MAGHKWADYDDDDYDDYDDYEEKANQLPRQSIKTNTDGSRTIVAWRLNDDGKKVKTTRHICTVKHIAYGNPRVADRKLWVKFGAEGGNPTGPDLATTSVGENIVFQLLTHWKAQEKSDKSEEMKLKHRLRDKKVTCRLCEADHFTASCPLKGTMAASEDIDPGDGDVPGQEDNSTGALGSGEGGSYVPPHLRGRATGAGETMNGSESKHERDDECTLRITSLAETTEEHELRGIFARFGRITRTYLARDRETQRVKGFAFITFADKEDAIMAMNRMNGYGYQHLILNVERAAARKV